MREPCAPCPLLRGLRLAAAGCALFALIGCGSLGPRTLDRDQLDYGNSIGDNWKNQMLANLVKVRFVDMPVFVDVGQIVSGYTLETQVSGSLGFGTRLDGGDSQSLGAAGRYTDRPTITYTPKTGDDYLRSLLTPVEPKSLLSLVAAGYNPDLLFTWAVESINGLHNHSASGRDRRAADPGYFEFVGLLTELQQDGAVGFEVRDDPATGSTLLFTFSDRKLSEELRAKRNRVRELLGLEPGRHEFRVVFSPFAVDPGTLAIQTRSILQVLIAMSGFVDVPPEKSARAAPGIVLAPGLARPFNVHSGPQKPDDVFAIYPYQGDWYWIDHEDIGSKRVFTLMLFLITLTDRAGSEVAPVLTIPTN